MSRIKCQENIITSLSQKILATNREDETSYDNNLPPASVNGGRYLEKKTTATKGRSPALQRCKL